MCFFTFMFELKSFIYSLLCESLPSFCDTNSFLEKISHYSEILTPFFERGSCYILLNYRTGSFYVTLAETDFQRNTVEILSAWNVAFKPTTHQLDCKIGRILTDAQKYVTSTFFQLSPADFKSPRRACRGRREQTESFLWNNLSVFWKGGVAPVKV